MKKTSCLIITLIALLSAVMVSCGNKQDFEIALKEESTDTVSGTEESEAATANTQEVSSEETQQTTYIVHVCGAVNEPDVYEVKSDARLVDAIKAAGGFTEDASIDYLNLADYVTDGQKIYVPTMQEVADGTVPDFRTDAILTQGADSASDEGSSDHNGSGKVNINTATIEELKTLNGIGDKRAKDIIDYRDSHGGFNSIEEIKNVTGIKDALYSKICDYIEV